MRLHSVYFRKYGSFQDEWAGFSELTPITVIVGKNNSGKSHLLKLPQLLASRKLKTDSAEFLVCTSPLKREQVQRIPKKRHDEADALLSGTVWWEIDSSGSLKRLLDSERKLVGDKQFQNECLRILGQIWPSALEHSIVGSEFVSIAAERDLRAEPATDALDISPSGDGATNVIRRFLTSSDEKLPHELIQSDFLEALNQIFKGDARFTGIQIRVHDRGSDIRQQAWEVYLEEPHKGFVPLSASGSGLKTVFQVLLVLLVEPRIKAVAKSRLTLAFEELENNLHPSALRRLLTYIENYVVSNKCRLFLTTHSSVTVDRFAFSKNAQIIHVRHDGKTATAQRIEAHLDRTGVVSDLGAKPSDLLQANCLIWVEGRSDAIYVNRWVDLWSEGRLVEGRDYQCVFYGGASLSGVTFSQPDFETSELLQYITINPNVIVICDSDRRKKGAHLKERVRRIRDELKKVPDSFLWITAGTEIENYLTGSSIAKAIGKADDFPDPEEFEAFFPKKATHGESYLEKRAKRKTINKVDLALKTAPHLSREQMHGRFDWQRQMEALCERIERWNSDPSV